MVNRITVMTTSNTNFVSIVPNKDTNAAITAYTQSPDYGYVQVSSTEMSVENGWVREKNRSTLIRAKVTELEKFVKHFAKGDKLPGRIQIQEFLESDVPEVFQSRFDKNKDYEAAIAPYIKRAGAKGPELTIGGERILRFTDYILTPTEQHADVMIAHDNGADVSAWRADIAALQTTAATPPAKAALPK